MDIDGCIVDPLSRRGVSFAVAFWVFSHGRMKHAWEDLESKMGLFLYGKMADRSQCYSLFEHTRASV